MHQMRGVEEFHARQRRIAPRMTLEAQVVHGHEDAVSADESQPEVNLAERLIHHAAGGFREPEIGSRKHPEDRRHAHDHVEVSDHEIAVVERQV